MSFPVFASGDVLNASDMNGVGLWLVKSQVVGTTVASVTVTGAFSADYDNYRIIYAGGASSAAVTNLALRLGASTTGYYSCTFFASVGAATVSNSGVNNGASWTYGGLATTTATVMCFDLLNPFLTKSTIFANGTYNEPNTTFGTTNGVHSVTTSYADFTITPGSGTLTGGTIRVYGYRN